MPGNFWTKNISILEGVEISSTKIDVFVPGTLIDFYFTPIFISNGESFCQCWL